METGLTAVNLSDVYIDIHCHQSDAKHAIEIVSIGTQDFDVAAPPSGRYSVGLHPWHLDLENIDTALRKMRAASSTPNLMGIGECGLDKAIAMPFARQTEAFIRQINLANQVGKPLIIHCVRTFNELIAIKKSTSNSKIPWIIHGFSGNPALAKQLIKHGFYLSFGAALLDSRSHAGDAMRGIPEDRLFLETDTSALKIDVIYAAAAKMRDLDIACLQRQILSNFQRVFLND